MLALLISSWTSAQAAEVGFVKKLTGNVTMISPDGTTRMLHQEDKLIEGDALSSEQGAEALIKFVDGSVLILRQNSNLSITEFQFNQKPEDSVVTRLVKGSLRYVTGLLGKLQPNNVHFSSPNSTIGIRGTDFELSVIEDGQETRSGEYNYVYDGGTNMQIATGEAVDVGAEQAGFAPAHPMPGEARLQLLKEKPAFLRGGGFDAMMMQLSRPIPLMPMRR